MRNILTIKEAEEIWNLCREIDTILNAPMIDSSRKERIRYATNLIRNRLQPIIGTTNPVDRRDNL